MSDPIENLFSENAIIILKNGVGDVRFQDDVSLEYPFDKYGPYGQFLFRKDGGN